MAKIFQLEQLLKGDLRWYILMWFASKTEQRQGIKSWTSFRSWILDKQWAPQTGQQPGPEFWTSFRSRILDEQ